MYSGQRETRIAVGSRIKVHGRPTKEDGKSSGQAEAVVSNPAPILLGAFHHSTRGFLSLQRQHTVEAANNQWFGFYPGIKAL
jgi:hypothetical protein